MEFLEVVKGFESRPGRIQTLLPLPHSFHHVSPCPVPFVPTPISFLPVQLASVMAAGWSCRSLSSHRWMDVQLRFAAQVSDCS